LTSTTFSSIAWGPTPRAKAPSACNFDYLIGSKLFEEGDLASVNEVHREVIEGSHKENDCDHRKGIQRNVLIR
jgi:hypothetical protein